LVLFKTEKLGILRSFRQISRGFGALADRDAGDLVLIQKDKLVIQGPFGQISWGFSAIQTDSGEFGVF